MVRPAERPAELRGTLAADDWADQERLATEQLRDERERDKKQTDETYGLSEQDERRSSSMPRRCSPFRLTNQEQATSIGDAYAVAAASDLDNDSDRDVVLLVGADDDYDVFEDEARFGHRIERFRDESA